MLLPPHRLVSTLEERIAPLETEFHRAYWDSQIEASEATERRRAELELELRRAKGDPEALAAVEASLAESLHDAELRRQLEVLRLSLTANQMDESRRAEIVELSSSIETDFASYRPELDGKRVTENDVDKILKSSDDQDLRRRAWMASKEIGAQVADRVRELARLRNQAARDLGFADFYQMSLQLQEIEEPWLFGLLGEVEQLTEEPFKQWKHALDDHLSERFGTKELFPWHYADPFFQTVPPDGTIDLDHVFRDLNAEEVARETFARWNIDLAPTFARSDLYPRENKSQHAFCLDVDRSGQDVRILANIVPGQRWVEVLLHESGHAAYDVCIESRLPYFLRRPAHTFVTEAIALLCGRLVHDSRWLSEVANLSDEALEEVAQGLDTAAAKQNLLMARWVLVMTYFERDFYADPEVDAAALWWELVQRFQLIAPPPGRVEPDWAAKVHIAVAPVYYHNYLLGDLLASQLRGAIQTNCGDLVGSADAGEFLKTRVFRPGNLLRWDALIEEATGRPLAAQDFAAEVS